MPIFLPIIKILSKKFASMMSHPGHGTGGGGGEGRGGGGGSTVVPLSPSVTLLASRSPQNVLKLLTKS